MAVFYLIRHGQKEKTDKDPNLTTEGHNQAEKTGRYLRQYPITQIIASPMARTQQTASHISNNFGIAFSIDDRLKERMDFGEGRHRDRNDFFQEWTRATWEREFEPKSGYSSITTGKRIEQLISEVEKGSDNHVAVVTHGGAIADFLRNIFPSEVLRPLEFEFQEGKDFRIDECSVTIIEKENESWRMVTCHATEHLLNTL
jgi:broad specificity phosphatase PhoE